MAIRNNKGQFVKGHPSIVKGGKRPNFHGNSGSFKKGVSVSPQTQFKKGIVPKNKGTGRITNCNTCGKEFHNRQGNRKYCSTKCMWDDKDYVNKINKSKKCPRPNSQGKKRPSASGENNYRWKGGINSENRRCRTSLDWRKWRMNVFSRDGFICQKCFRRGIFLHPHHIISVKECISSGRKDLIFDVKNGITYCKECHMDFHGLLGRR